MLPTTYSRTAAIVVVVVVAAAANATALQPTVHRATLIAVAAVDVAAPFLAAIRTVAAAIARPRIAGAAATLPTTIYP